MDEFEKFKKQLVKVFSKDYVSQEEFVTIFRAIQKAIDTLKVVNSTEYSKAVSAFTDRINTLESGFRTRLGATNASVGNKANRQDVEAVKFAIANAKADIYLALEELRGLIPAVPTFEDFKDRLIKERNIIPVEVIKGHENMVQKDQFETAIIEIGGKFTVIEKRIAKGYGALGGGSEGTGSLFLSRLRDVNTTGLLKDSDGKWLLGSGNGGGTGGGGSFSPIVISGTINDSNVTFTAPEEPDLLVINGETFQSTGGEITWSYSSGTVTLSQPVGTGGSIFGLEYSNGGGGGGAVDSVNGQTGVVVLDAGDVGADPSGSAASALVSANTYTDTQISSVQTQIDGKQFYTFITVGYSDSDYIVDGTADDVQVRAAIVAANAAGGGIVCLKDGDFYFLEKVQVLSNVTLMSFNPSSTTIHTTTTISGGIHRALLEVSNTVNVTIKNISFNVNTNNNAILLAGFTNVRIKGCNFTGTGAGQAMITMGTYTSTSGVYYGAIIEECRFEDCTGTYPIYFYTFSGRGPISDVTIRNNYFSNVKFSCIKFTATNGLVNNISILNNRAYNVVGQPTGGTTNGTFVTGGLDKDYQIRDVYIKGNYYENDLPDTKKGFVFFYSADNIQIIGNTALDLSDDESGCIFMAPGRVQFPIRGLMIKDNWIEGWQAFWDPDSMTDVEVSGNTVKNCLTGIPMGYGVQDRIDIHDNKIYNCAQSNFPAAIVVGTQTSGKNVKYHDNIIYDDRADTPVIYFLMTTGNGVYDNKHIEVYNNKVYLPNITLTQHMYKQFSNNLLPQRVFGNLIVDASGRTDVTISVRGNITGATTFDIGFGWYHTAILTGNVTATITDGYYTGQKLILKLSQDATGGRTITWPANFKKNSGTLVLSLGPGAVDTIEMMWDGSNWIESARLMDLS